MIDGIPNRALYFFYQKDIIGCDAQGLPALRWKACSFHSRTQRAGEATGL